MSTINWERVNTFADMNDPEDLEWLRETAKELVVSMNQKLETINSLLTTPDREALVSICHQIKGVSSNFGLDSVYEICLNAEKILKTDAWESSLPILANLNTIWIDSSEELSQVLKI
jgi:HPt (histidine-containing phosphotransfer) domain-containing protein